MTNKFKSVRGMQDIKEDDAKIFSYLESFLKKIAIEFSYNEIHLPILEQTELYLRGVGAQTDIMQKEIYNFIDKDEKNICLRPEGTAGCLRALNQHGMLYNLEQKVFYLGPMFRRERPQKGRFRQFHQFGVESFAQDDIKAEIELILMSFSVFKKLNLLEKVNLEINTLGKIDDREIYIQELTLYLEDYKDDLDEDSKKRLYTNPLRILDSKNKTTQEILKNAPSLKDYINKDSFDKFATITKSLKDLDIDFVVNNKLVRGLDYYNDFVFEWICKSNIGKNAVCAGGRFDNLPKILGAHETKAIGFAFGIERLGLLLSKEQIEQILKDFEVDVYLISNNLDSMYLVQKNLLDKVKNLKIYLDTSTKTVKKQIMKAINKKAKIIVKKEDDLYYKISHLDKNRENKLLEFDNLFAYIQNFFKDK